MRFSVTTSDKAGAVNIQLNGHDQTFFIMSNIPTIETMSSEQILELKQKINLAHLLLSIAENSQIWGPFRINFAGKPICGNNEYEIMNAPPSRVPVKERT